MRKLFITAAVLITGFTINTASAQVVESTTGTTILSVTLNTVQSITVNNPTVGLNFATSADYLNGKTFKQPNHLTFSSTSGFFITATAATNLTGGTGDDIEISTVTITPEAGNIGSLPTGVFTPNPLEVALPVTIFTTGPGHIAGGTPTGGTTEASLNIDYTAKTKALGDYLNRKGKFSSTITYTIAPN